MSDLALDGIIEEWRELQKEYSVLEDVHKDYCKKVLAVKEVQGKCMSGIAHQRYRMKQLQDSLKRMSKSADAEGKQKVQDVQKDMAEAKSNMREMEEVLPHENGLYLKVILGSVNVSLLSKQDKFKYKEDYERFKLVVTVITMVLAICLWFFLHYRVTDAAFQFLLVWYYCTLTIREHILKVNGSRIKGWWISHHFIATLSAGIILIWPDGWSYSQFRSQFVVFSFYMSVVQMVQYYYQRSCLYKMRALGERHSMDLTVEGFQSWMWRGLTFVLPFLVVGYFFQLYNAWVLFTLSRDERCTEWQVIFSAFLFFTLFFGNSVTTGSVIRQKLRKHIRSLDHRLRNKYRFNNKVHES